MEIWRKQLNKTHTEFQIPRNHVLSFGEVCSKLVNLLPTFEPFEPIKLFIQMRQYLHGELEQIKRTAKKEAEREFAEMICSGQSPSNTVYTKEEAKDEKSNLNQDSQKTLDDKQRIKESKQRFERRLTELNEDYEKHTKELFERMISRGKKERELDQKMSQLSIDSVKSSERESLATIERWERDIDQKIKEEEEKSEIQQIKDSINQSNNQESGPIRDPRSLTDEELKKTLEEIEDLELKQAIALSMQLDIQEFYEKKLKENQSKAQEPVLTDYEYCRDHERKENKEEEEEEEEEEDTLTEKMEGIN